MTEKDLVTLLETEYLAKILGFCYQKLNDREAAEDLASDIMLEVMKVIRSGKAIENFNALVWSISNHTFCKFLRARKRGTTVYMTELIESSENVEAEYERKEQEQLLYRELALLSEKYRKAVVMRYFENKSCEEIAELLGQSSGTVKWWLSEARKSMKEGMDHMREYGEKSFNPEMLTVSCQGAPGMDNEPMSYAKRKLAQNILLAAYEEPASIKELCVELGVSAAYVEDEVAALVDNRLMKEVSRGKYQTDFVILPGNNAAIGHKIQEACFPKYYEELMNFLNQHKEMLTGERFNIAGFSWERLLWVYLHIFTDFALSGFKREVCKIVSWSEIPERPNGGKWIAIGYKNGVFSDVNQKMAGWKEYLSFDGPVHKAKDVVQGFFHYWSGADSTPFFEIPDGTFDLLGRVIKGEAVPEHMTEEQKLLFSEAVAKNLFLNENGTFQQNYYFVRKKEAEELLGLIEEFSEIAKPYFEAAWKLILSEYEKTVPKHLHGQMGNFLSNHLNLFVTGSLYEGVRNKVLSDSNMEGKEWLSLFSMEV